MNIRLRKSHAALALVSSALALFAVSISLAQSSSPTPATGKKTDDTVRLEKFVVTGSLLPTAEGETFSPVAVVTYDQMIRLGAGAAIEALRTLPDMTGNVATEQRTNGGTGAAGVNLRGLAGTLTIFDGRRTAAFDNFNVIPTIAIERIEVVKDGAGAIYGSDALSGVYNTVMVSHFNGVRTDFYYGNTTKNDTGVMRGGVLAGYTLDKTNVVLAAEYYNRHALHSSDREPSDQADQRFRGGINGGSPTFSGRATARIGSATAPVQDLVLAPGKTVGLTSADFVPFNTVTATSNQFLNFRQYTPSIPADERASFYGRLNQKLGDQVEAYVRLIFTRDRFYDGLAPSPMPTPSTTNSAARDLLLAERASPHIPTGFFIQDDVRSSPGNILNGAELFRTIALGPRQQIFTRHSYDFVAGLTGKFGSDWTWNAGYVFGELYRDQLQQGAPGKTKLVALIRDGSYNPFALDTAKGTGPTGKAFDNPAALAASAASGNTHLRGTTRGVDANLSGTIFNLPAGEVKLGLGTDYYRNDASSVPDAIFFSGDLLGLNGSNPTISRSYGAGAFAALFVPVIKPAMNVPLVHSLKLQGEGRYDYQTVEGYQDGASGADIGHSFVAQNPKVGVQWHPVEDLLIRGTWSTGFRLPSLGALFNAPGTSNPILIDPLGFPIANQTPITTRGNPNLSPEKSRTYSVGFVYSPKGVGGLSISADYYSGEITGLVGEGSQYILNVNAAGQGSGFVRGNPATINPNAPFANLISRSATGGVTTIASSNFNISARKTTGIDWQINYVWPWKQFGRLQTRIDWNTALTWDLTPVEGQPAQSYLATYIDVSQNAISPGSIPRHKGSVSQSWSSGKWHVMVTGNYISKLQDNPSFTQGNVMRWVEAWPTLDANVEYQLSMGDRGWRRWISDTTVRVGGTNLTDNSAPFAAGAFNDSYDVTTHSNRGRFLYVQLSRKF